MSPLSWYSRWDGSQRLDDLDADQLLDAMSDDLLSDGDPWSALRRLFQRGAKNPDGANLPGLQDLLNRLRRKMAAASGPFSQSRKRACSASCPLLT